ncbi:MAG: hypothetical protein ACERNK_09860 [Deltaproteobacteria bacterium]
MMRYETLRLFAISAVAVCMGGCSLLVDFDRSLLVDAGVDAGVDASVDASVDVRPDEMAEVGEDAGVDAN